MHKISGLFTLLNTVCRNQVPPCVLCQTLRKIPDKQVAGHCASGTLKIISPRNGQ